MPAPITIGMKPALMPWRCGRPKEMLERPQVVLTLSSSRSRRSSANTWRPASPSAPIGMTSGSTTTSWAGMPKSAQRSTIFLATAKRTSGSIEMPVSSLEIATTGTLYFLISGRMASSFSSSPVTEFTSGRPLATFSAASIAAVTELSIDSGRSTRFCTISSVCTRRPGSVSFGLTEVTPAFTSSMVAPQAACSSASLMTVSKLPSIISAASFLRPVGLMRSPITQKG